MLLLVAIEVSYLFIITAGTFTTWSTWNTNYDLIAEGFRAGVRRSTLIAPASAYWHGDGH